MNQKYYFYLSGVVYDSQCTCTPIQIVINDIASFMTVGSAYKHACLTFSRQDSCFEVGHSKLISS